MVTGKVHIRSFGCQMNKLDTSLVSSALAERGFTETAHVGEADAVVINTCSVREHAEQKVLSHLGHLKHLKRHRDIVVAVIGCMAQRLGQELLDNEAVDIVAGPAQLYLVPGFIVEALEGKGKVLSTKEKIRGKVSDEESFKLDSFEKDYDRQMSTLPGQVFVRAMRGCNQFCSYCVVPFVRGPEVSRSPFDIVEQVNRHAGQGVRQVTLVGQTINSYCYERNGKQFNLADLLYMVSEVEGIEWIRFITSHPSKFDESIFRAMAEIDKVCAYLHIPAQSGSDRILKQMKRGYTRDEYLRLIERARRIVPGAAVAGDFIVGYPGESDEDFAATCDLVREVRYKNCFVFKYSPRPGTQSDAKLADSVAADIKKQRNVELLAIQNEISEQDNKRFIGKTVKVLVEGPSRKSHLDCAGTGSHPQLIARTAGDYIVVFNGPIELAGHFAEVKIVKTSALTLFGQMD